MFLLGREFVKTPDQKRRRYTLNTLADRLFIPSAVLEPIIARLMQAGLIVVAEDDSLLPGRDLAAIRSADIFGSVRSSIDAAAAQVRSTIEADAIAEQTEEAVRTVLQGKTLKQWLDESPAIPDSNLPSGS